MFRRAACLLTACGLGLVARGQVTFFSGGSAHANWVAAASGTQVTLDFDPISAGTQANNAAFVTYAATAGVVFQPFSNASYPEVISGQGGIGTGGPLWLGNVESQGFAAGNAIAWTFNRPVRAFGFYDVGSDDGFDVSLYAADTTTLLNSFNTTEQSGTPLFWGFLASEDIGRVQVRPRIGNGYIGIDALTVAIPEPTSIAALAGLAAAAFAWRRRRRT